MFTSPKPPTQVEGLFNQRMTRLEQKRSSLGGSAARSYWRDPLAVYFCPLEAIQDGRNELAARSVGWRYLVIEGGRFVEQADIGSQDDGNAEWQGLMRGEARLNDLARALEGVENAVAGGNYELRVLIVPALYVTALWLKEVAANGAFPNNADRFIPVGNSPGLPGGGLQNGKDFWEALRRIASTFASEGELGGLAPDPSTP